ncbi:unnamed protein product [Orchesella dallaii]|uniref:Double-strand-break repair protein rad21 n=1 Tax=Orchesella dallaii TaxID=48710 RepID=A0ABP1QWA9_9HEXA
MFFNDDILFRNGRLALVWRVGTLELENKKKRKKKDVQAVVESSLTIICGDIRKLFPKMGTAHGIGLSKMGTLVKGVGAMYCLKIDKLARDIYEATLLLRRPIIIADPRIDVRLVSKSKGSKTIPAREPLSVDEFGKLCMRANEEAVGIAGVDSEDFFASPRAIGEMFASPRAMPSRISDYRASISFGIPSPARSIEGEEEGRGRENERRKRRRNSDTEQAMHDDVIQRLERFFDVNARADLLEDDQPLFPADEQLHPEFDFGGEQAMFDMLNMGDNVEAGGMEPQLQPLDMPPMEMESSVTGMMSPIGGPPTELELRSKTLETPPGAGTRPENVKRRRLDQGREPDSTVMELESMPEFPERERDRGRIRPRKRLLIDEETTVSSKEMLDRINALRTETNMSLLQHRLIQTRAPAKSTWKAVPRNLQFIKQAGRVIKSSALHDLLDEILSAQLRKPEKIGFEQYGEREPEDAQQTTRRLHQIPDATIEQEREQTASTSIGISAGTTGLQGERTAVEVPPPSPQIHDEGYQDRGAMEDGIIDVPPMDVGVPLSPRAEEIDPCPFAVPERVSRRRVDESVVEDLSRRMTGGNTFQELFPPRQVSRKKAAHGFFMLLKMQATKEVMLLQDEPYGPITIEKLSLRSQ